MGSGAAGAAGASGVRLEQLLSAIDSEVFGTLDASAGGEAASPRKGRAWERYVVFSLGVTRYAAPVPSVIEINRVPEITPVPNVPEWVKGVCNLRGDILSVVDLRGFLGMDADSRDSRRILVVRAGNDEITGCLIVDAVHGTLPLSADQIREPQAPIQDRLAPYLLGVSEEGDRLVVILDVEKLLLSREMRQFE